MKKPPAVSEHSYVIDRPSSGLRSPSDGVIEGSVHTIYGTVVVYQYSQSKYHPAIYLSMARDGRLYHRMLRRKPTTTRGLAILATRFARDVKVRALMGRR